MIATEKKKRVYKQKKLEMGVAGPSNARSERVLFPHQIESVELMEKAETGVPLKDKYTGFDIYYSFGTLKNPVGSGKTSTVLQVIKNDKLKFETVDKLSIRTSNGYYGMVQGDPRSFFADVETGDAMLNESSMLVFHTSPVNVVVCTKPLTNVWKSEADAMGVAVVIVDTPAHVKSIHVFEDRVKDVMTVGNGVIVTTTMIHGQVMDFLLDLASNPIPGREHPPHQSRGRHYLCIKRLILDDIHSVSKWTSNYAKLAPLFTWCVNTTPKMIRWDKFEKYISTCFLTRPAFSSLYERRPRGHVVKVQVPTEVYQEPEVRVNKIRYKRNAVADMIGGHLPNAVKEMLNTGDFDGAYRYMVNMCRPEGEAETQGQDQESSPNQTIAERRPIHELAMEGYKVELDKLVRRRLQIVELGGNPRIVNEQIIAQESKIKALEERLNQAIQETCECPICMDDVERGGMIVTKCCNNAFCKGCIKEVFRTNRICPLCRTKLTPLNIFSLSGDGTAVDISTLNEIGRTMGRTTCASNPMEALMNLVTSKPRGSRFVVFAPSEGSSAAFKTYFANSGYTLVDLRGSSASIRNRLREFEDGSISVLFLSSKTSNAGLNLQYASDVVIIDSTDNVLDPDSGFYKQSIGRVRRFPRTELVPVHHITPF